jgi:hypothetical protein
VKNRAPEDGTVIWVIVKTRAYENWFEEKSEGDGKGR